MNSETGRAVGEGCYHSFHDRAPFFSFFAALWAGSRRVIGIRRSGWSQHGPMARSVLPVELTLGGARGSYAKNCSSEPESGLVLVATQEGNNCAWMCLCGCTLPLMGTTRKGAGDTECPACDRKYRVLPHPHTGDVAMGVQEL